jgi:hypothetical protein
MAQEVIKAGQQPWHLLLPTVLLLALACALLLLLLKLGLHLLIQLRCA